jgi:hypothetical protein
MDNRVLSVVLMVVGTVLFAICLLADIIGLGANTTTIGWKQYFGAAMGIVIFLFGLHIALHHTVSRN